MRLKRFLLAVVALIATAGAVAIAQQFPNLPTLSGPSYCAGFSTGPTGQVCSVTVPAGPTSVTGNETIPGDTNAPGGQQPQTVKIPITVFGGGATQVVTTNANVALADGVSTLISNQGAATIALINLPINPKDGQTVRIVNAGSGVLTLTSIAVGVGSGDTIVQGAAPASLAIQTNNAVAAAASSVAYRFNAANSTWYRLD